MNKVTVCRGVAAAIRSKRAARRDVTPCLLGGCSRAQGIHRRLAGLPAVEAVVEL